MKKCTLLLAALIINLIMSAQTTTIAPGFTVNSSPTFTSNGFTSPTNANILKRDNDSLKFKTGANDNIFINTLQLNQVYDTIKVTMDVYFYNHATMTVTVNDSTRIINNYNFQYHGNFTMTVLNTSQLNYTITVNGYINSFNNVQALSAYSVKLIKNPLPAEISEKASFIDKMGAFPNPNNGEFKLQFESKVEKAPIRVYNTQGDLVLENNEPRTVGQNTIDLKANLASGVYFVKAGEQSIKWVVCHQ